MEADLGRVLDPWWIGHEPRVDPSADDDGTDAPMDPEVRAQAVGLDLDLVAGAAYFVDQINKEGFNRVIHFSIHVGIQSGWVPSGNGSVGDWEPFAFDVARRDGTIGPAVPLAVPRVPG